MQTLVIGLTGGIGSGKSAVSALFESLGITVVDADIAARTIVEPGKPAMAEIAKTFGTEVVLPDGTMDRALMRQIVFADPAKRKQLEAITHPRIRDEIQRGLAAAISPYAILVSPLLLESGQNAFTERVLVVDVSEETQLARTMSRDSNSAEQVRAIIASQISRERRLAAADDIINNDGSLDDLKPKVLDLHRRYLALAASQRGEESNP